MRTKFRDAHKIGHARLHARHGHVSGTRAGRAWGAYKGGQREPRPTWRQSLSPPHRAGDRRPLLTAAARWPRRGRGPGRGRRVPSRLTSSWRRPKTAGKARRPRPAGTDQRSHPAHRHAAARSHDIMASIFQFLAGGSDLGRAGCTCKLWHEASQQERGQPGSRTRLRPISLPPISAGELTVPAAPATGGPVEDAVPAVNTARAAAIGVSNAHLRCVWRCREWPLITSLTAAVPTLSYRRIYAQRKMVVLPEPIAGRSYCPSKLLCRATPPPSDSRETLVELGDVPGHDTATAGQAVWACSRRQQSIEISSASRSRRWSTPIKPPGAGVACARACLDGALGAYVRTIWPSLGRSNAFQCRSNAVPMPFATLRVCLHLTKSAPQCACREARCSTAGSYGVHQFVLRVFLQASRSACWGGT